MHVVIIVFINNLYVIRLTEDIAIFATSVAHLYSSVTKPFFDLMLIGFALMRSTQKMKANVVSGTINTYYKSFSVNI